MLYVLIVSSIPPISDNKSALFDNKIGEANAENTLLRFDVPHIWCEMYPEVE